MTIKQLIKANGTRMGAHELTGKKTQFAVSKVCKIEFADLEKELY